MPATTWLTRLSSPRSLRANPTYRKVNPSAAPVMILALTSKTKTPGQIYDEASNTLNQQLLQIEGVGDVQIGGGSMPAVRIELKPFVREKKDPRLLRRVFPGRDIRLDGDS